MAADDDTQNETQAQAQEIKPIPEPAGLPLIGNLTSFDRSFPLGSFTRLADQFGEHSPETAG